MILAGVSIALSVLLLTLSLFVSRVADSVLSKHLLTMPYECGFDPYNQALSSALAKFYLVALLYLIFDLELAIILPLATFFPFVHVTLNIIIALIVILVLGFGYERMNNIISNSHFI